MKITIFIVILCIASNIVFASANSDLTFNQLKQNSYNEQLLSLEKEKINISFLDHINNGFTFGALGSSLSFADDKYIEKGTIPGLTYSASGVFAKHFYTKLYLDYSFGNLKYDGALIDSKNSTKNSRRNSVFNADINLGYTIPIYSSFQLIPYFGVGYRFWDRATDDDFFCINKATYQHYNAFLGIKLNWELVSNKLFVSPHMQYGKIIYSNMKHDRKEREVELKGGGKTNIPGLLLDFNLGKESTYGLGVDLDYHLFDNFSLNTFINYTYFQYKQSDLQKGYYEPNSKTSETKFGIALRYTWKNIDL
ncbi:conserved exported hypothetical protein [Gammaproteobacteria bacterium]